MRIVSGPVVRDGAAFQREASGRADQHTAACAGRVAAADHAAAADMVTA